MYIKQPYVMNNNCNICKISKNNENCKNSLKPKEFAKIANVTKATVYYWVRTKKIRYEKTHDLKKNIMIPKSEFDRLLKS